MNESILGVVSCGLLGAGYLDVKYLVELLDRFDLDFYEVLDEVSMNFGADGKLDFNIIIYETLTQIAYKFMDDNKKLFESHQDDFSIYTNYMDSHIYFEDEEVQGIFEGYF